MELQTCLIDSDESLRKNLMAPDPMQRTLALHALEIAIERSADQATTGLVSEVACFTARGIPFYSLQDPHFCEWVGQAVLYWQRLHAEKSAPRPARGRKHGAGHQPKFAPELVVRDAEDVCSEGRPSPG